MRFTIEQIFLTDPGGSRSPAASQYHLVEADTVDEGLDQFLASSSATLVGTVRKFPGLHAVATARSHDSVFAMNLLPGSDPFHRST